MVVGSLRQENRWGEGSISGVHQAVGRKERVRCPSGRRLGWGGGSMSGVRRAGE
jgi:hypothetical protein